MKPIMTDRTIRVFTDNGGKDFDTLEGALDSNLRLLINRELGDHPDLDDVEEFIRHRAAEISEYYEVRRHITDAAPYKAGREAIERGCHVEPLHGGT